MAALVNCHKLPSSCWLKAKFPAVPVRPFRMGSCANSDLPHFTPFQPHRQLKQALHASASEFCTCPSTDTLGSHIGVFAPRSPHRWGLPRQPYLNTNLPPSPAGPGFPSIHPISQLCFSPGHVSLSKTLFIWCAHCLIASQSQFRAWWMQRFCFVHY